MVASPMVSGIRFSGRRVSCRRIRAGGSAARARPPPTAGGRSGYSGVTTPTQHAKVTRNSMKGPHMHVDAMSRISASPIEAEAAALAAERAGYDGIGLPETKHDVFTTLTLAARATTTINLQSAIAVAFARNPMTVAYCANDVQLISGGRLQLGLGSQVQPHVERRFAMPWSAPAARMEDFIAAVRAIWTAWSSGNRLMYKGRFYSHTLMTEFFNPGPNEFGNPPIWLAAVGAKMSAVAGRVADGLICHSFTTEAYLREVTLPAVA